MTRLEHDAWPDDLAARADEYRDRAETDPDRQEDRP